MRMSLMPISFNCNGLRWERTSAIKERIIIVSKIIRDLSLPCIFISILVVNNAWIPRCIGSEDYVWQCPKLLVREWPDGHVWQTIDHVERNSIAIKCGDELFAFAELE